MKNRWAMLLAVLLIPVGQLAQNDAQTLPFQIKDIYSRFFTVKASRTLQSR